MNLMYHLFSGDIARMNQVYDLKPLEWRRDQLIKRLEQFKEILDKEFTELQDIQIAADRPGEDESVMVQRTVVDMADLLSDIIVYCASEAMRWNIPLGDTLRIVMMSNFSKLGADGLPIKNPVTDKFEKGPNYWKPEPSIHALLFPQPLSNGGEQNLSEGV